MGKEKWKIIKLSIYLVLIAIVLAYFEVQIEGPNGWAGVLPTWKTESKWFTWIFAGRPVTGYHVALNLLLFLFFHWPFLFVKWNLADELSIIASNTILAVIWDFLWFIINPYFGFEKYRPENIWWFKNWLLGFPIDYYVGILVSFVIFFLSSYNRHKNVKKGIAESALFTLLCIIGTGIFAFLYTWIAGMI